MVWYNLFYKPKNKENMKDENKYGTFKIGAFSSLHQNKAYDQFKITSEDIEKVNDSWINGHIIPEDKLMFRAHPTGKEINSAYAKAVKDCKEI